MAWRRPDKPLSEPMIVSLLTNTLGINELNTNLQILDHNICPNGLIFLQFYTEHGRTLCKISKSLGNWAIDGQKSFSGCGFKMRFERISYIVQHPHLQPEASAPVHYFGGDF